MNDDLTCQSCLHSIAELDALARPVLKCQLSNEKARRRCNEFEYEPGTDEKEHDE